MKHGLSLIVLGFGLAGIAACEGLQKYEAPTNKVIQDGQPIADAVGGATGTPAGVIWSALGGLAAAVFGVNRTIVAMRRKQALVEVNNNPNTPPVVNQVVSESAKAEAAKLPGTGAGPSA